MIDALIIMHISTDSDIIVFLFIFDATLESTYAIRS